MTDNKHSEKSVFRILDAAINRAGEGLRVVEEYARMVLEDAHLSEQLKQLRHDLTKSVSSLDPIQRMAARDTVGDVGTTIQVETEYDRGSDPTVPTRSRNDTRRSSVDSKVIQANFARAQQAIRTIEEFSKSLDDELAKNVEQLRYRVYTLEKAMLTTVFSLRNLSDASLYVLIDASGDVESRVNVLIQSEVTLIQLRDNSLTDRKLVELGRKLKSLTRDSETKLIINDRADLAVAIDADGVHLGQDDLKVNEARRIVGAAKMIGVSTHSIEQARQAVVDGANYIGVGPVFESKTKHFDSHVGLALVRQVANEIQLPAFAIGGIDRTNVGEVVAAGSRRIAVSAAVAAALNPRDEIDQLLRALAAHSVEGRL